MGGNEEAARLSGIKVEGVYRNVYIISAVLAAAAGILTAMTYSSASYSYGTNADLRVITTVAIGGTSLTHGGYGSVTGTLLGTLFMAMIYNAFVMSGISTYYQDVVTGAFLIAAVLMSEGMNILKKEAFIKGGELHEENNRIVYGWNYAGKCSGMQQRNIKGSGAGRTGFICCQGK